MSLCGRPAGLPWLMLPLFFISDKHEIYYSYCASRHKNTKRLFRSYTKALKILRAPLNHKYHKRSINARRHLGHGLKRELASLKHKDTKSKTQEDVTDIAVPATTVCGDNHFGDMGL
jgi:hypothetical protein